MKGQKCKKDEVEVEMRVNQRISDCCEKGLQDLGEVSG